MSVLIKDFRPPFGNEPRTFLTHFNNDCTAEMVAVGYPQKQYKLALIAPHGRLIDADNFIDRVKADVGMVEEDLSFEFKDGIWSVLKLLETQPTVIEAEV